MKLIIKTACTLLATSLLLTSCKKFDEVNVNPVAASGDQVQPEYFLNNSIIGAQQNPEVAERAFVLYWKTAGHQHSNGSFYSATYDDTFTTIYFNQVSGWLNSANTAISIAADKKASGTDAPYTNNVAQVARIWRAYLMSEMSDNFGPIPVLAFQSTNPDYNNVKDVYYYLLEELKDATSKIDVSVVNTDALKKLDPAYQYNYANWIRYANSMRMRLAMRLSEVDPAKAKTEFEAAAAGSNFISEKAETFEVQERPGWDNLTGVMSRDGNAQYISATLNNIYLGLGGVKSADQLDPKFLPFIKPANWLGLKLDDHFTSMTNNPSAGYWFDGLPETIDPRAYKTFIIPGDFENPNFSFFPIAQKDAITTVRKLNDKDNNVVKIIDAKFNWNASNTGDWGAKGTKNELRAYAGTMPRLSSKFRLSTNKRVFFAPWETYFLLAEAAERGWVTPVSGKAAYEAGIKSSFAYWEAEGLATYLTSEDFNRVGTSVSWDHITEPNSSHEMNYKDGYTDVAGVATVLYPKNDLYKKGTVKNDRLTKIITQKFIAQTPWLPLEAWNDQRRLGLPFFENPAIEIVLPNLPALNKSNYMESNVKFFPQRLRYPSGLRDTNAKGYEQALKALNGVDEVLTPLWWAQK
ncbi:SusD/RagB family nutrient-binding outer membrane lipoprotein [Pedobacter sp. PLR]|uniref:SusD/RagB family nutrient-binding outer membrane lipoprotein n=1 Tax=Pedobacter sp. PLR TaxID=2994465 RepID=UPI002246C422|nr:SusD/RagB family nutrient-binding outer membrane lipoprotein [Pedobacter sp. PLR]MCX2451075.1 SusD/RagB family nutrient-binding outer membrane lipoprotein [Pedobacter sp. PLR]